MDIAATGKYFEGWQVYDKAPSPLTAFSGGEDSVRPSSTQFRSDWLRPRSVTSKSDSVVARGIMLAAQSVGGHLLVTAVGEGASQEQPES